jgi:predicted nucleic acid-binding protein
MKEMVYIETSVISYYTSKPSRDIIIAARQAITREKWIKIVSSFKVFISALVIQEIEKGDSKAAQQRLASIQKFSILAIDDRAEQLAKRLIENRVVPQEYPGDALHIALAAVHGMDYLLTWNFTHINNAQMKNKIATVIMREGHNCPILCSPEELLGD